jgi:hypothetical protein
MPASDIIIKGAREHNLRDVSLVLPRNQLICLTGVSGSGKSSLAFDTLVAPVNELAFGTPTDIDHNGRVVIFFTRAVNELTPSGAAFYYGGFFHPRDLLPRRRDGVTYCEGSNEGEMFYMFVPDPDGVVNGNIRRRGFVDSVTVGTIAHEYEAGFGRTDSHSAGRFEVEDTQVVAGLHRAVRWSAMTVEPARYLARVFWTRRRRLKAAGVAVGNRARHVPFA